MTERRPHIGFRTLARSARAYAQLDRGVRRIQSFAQQAVHGLLYAALTPAERSAIAIEVYDSLHKSTELTGLHDWEAPWFEKWLPPAPARVLVGAAGAGREAVALRDMGYQVDAVEPARRPARDCQQRLGPDSRVFVSRLEDVASRALDGDDAALSPGSYDAVIIGWGALSLILDASDRELVMRGCDRLAPNGPILASFFLGSNDRPITRSQRLGSTAGRAVARLRRLPADASASARPLVFSGWFGFATSFSIREIEALGAAVGRRTEWEDDGATPTYPHACFVA